VNYVLEQDEDGYWCASATLRPGVAAFGEGETQEAAITDLRSGLELLLEEVDPPNEMAITLDVALFAVA
jgi:predicted RNase H-like HicB family nuclease